MNKMTFKEYVLLEARSFDTPECDFIADVQSAQGTFYELPDDFLDSWVAVRSFLIHCGACEEAVVAAHVVWDRYVQSQQMASGCP